MEGVYILPYITCLCLLHQVSFGYNISYVQHDIKGECWQRISNVGGIIFSHAGHHSYADNSDCKITIVTKPGLRIAIRFDSFDIKDSVNCYQDEVLVYDGAAFSSLTLSGTMRGLCGTTVPSDYEHIVSTGNEMTIRFITDNNISKNIGFTIVYTTIYPDYTSEDCFSCNENAMCIHKDLKCDGLPNCNDGSDETNSLCSPPTEKPIVIDDGWMTWMGTAFGVALAFAIVFLLLITLIICTCCGCNEPAGHGDVSDSQSYEAAIEPMIIPRPNSLQYISVGCSECGVNQKFPTLTERPDHQFSDLFIQPMRPDMRYLSANTLITTDEHYVELPPEHI
ncbi:uncharacterized protein LOC117117206 [Anneissia japonica]|uniref:uncharacterized protein LOC117117206 n=1 Tax=Anneissia japonica TaxID=1529436 RepID=UPI0014257FCF|nr:uncharacterized protein LOC117117206 [Anneissia japonica]